METIASTETTATAAPETRRRREMTVEPARMQLNLTSMIDVIFLLLIYFVITASFSADEGILTAKLPQGTGKVQDTPKPPERPIRIRIASLQSPVECRIDLVGLGRSPRHFGELFTLLAGMQMNDGNSAGVFKPDNPVIIEPDRHVRWQHVVNAFNAAVRAKFTNVSFAQATE